MGEAAYIEKLLEKFGIRNANAVDTHADTSTKLVNLLR